MNYFIKRGETEAGPYSQEQIQAWINEGLLTQNDFGRPEHSQEWLPLQAVIPSISPSSSPKTINAPAQAPQQNSLGMIAAIVGMFALLMGGGIAGVVYYTKKRKGQILKQTPREPSIKRMITGIRNPPQHKRQLKKRRPIRTPQTLFPSLYFPSENVCRFP